MGERFYYQEELFFTRDEDRELGEKKEKIVEMLRSNLAVGVVAGFFEEGYPIYFISHFALNNLGLNFGEFMERTGGRYLEAVYEKDRGIFEADFQEEGKEVREYRLLNRDGNPIWINEVRTQSVARDGRKIWVCSLRPMGENIRRQWLSEDEQYRQAIISEALFVFNVNVSRNSIEDDFYKIDRKQRTAILPLVGMQAPCSADAFFSRWGEQKVAAEDRENYSRCINMKYLAQAFERGETELVLEYETHIDDSAPVVLRHTILLIRDNASGDIVALNNLKDITQQRRQERETRRALQDAYEAANRASSAKTDFLSRMSHDIRTPMNAIIGMTAIAGTHLQEPEKLTECLGKITSASRHLLAIINEVLDMSKIEAGTLTLNEEEFNLSNLMDNLLGMVQPLAEEKGHTLKVHIHDIRHENVIGDSMRIQQAFVNIVNNSVKYTPDGGTICIELSEKSSGQVKTGCYEFVFEDNGIGMSPEFLTHLFEPFERAEDVRTSKVQGSGLGMPIARNIIRMMGGDIQVESQLEKGSRFTAQVLLKYQEEDAVSLTELIKLPVLVADDDEIACRSTCLMLDELGLHSEGVLSGEEAVERTFAAHSRREDYFAVILDWKMPGMDGIETAREIRRRVGPEVPIIILSGYDWSDCEMEARAAGVDAFITKPLFKSRLVSVLRSLAEDPHARERENSREELEKNLEHDFTGKRVLLVEDNELNREIATEILEMVGLEVESAENGSIAVDMVAAASPGYYNLVFMDIQMPVMNGYEATCAIRSLERRDAKYLPIVAMTANAFAEDIQAAKSSGMNEHMAKPIDLGRLMEVLEHWVR